MWKEENRLPEKEKLSLIKKLNENKNELENIQNWREKVQWNQKIEE
jgi:hypothetical protein